LGNRTAEAEHPFETVQKPPQGPQTVR
jgi:hypothetical protein